MAKVWNKISYMTQEEFARYAYWASLLVLGIFLLLYLILHIIGISLSSILPYNPCHFLKATGFYCPGCGGTRAVAFLFQGDIVNSLFYHPAVMYFVIGLIVFVLSHVLADLLKRETMRLLIKPVFFYGLIAVICIQFIYKNYFILSSGQYIIGYI